MLGELKKKEENIATCEMKQFARFIAKNVTVQYNMKLLLMCCSR